MSEKVTPRKAIASKNLVSTSKNEVTARPETDWVLPEPDQHRKSKSSFRFRFTGTGFSENQIPFRPDRISKFNRIPAGFHNLARLLPDFKIQPDSYRNPKVLTMLIT